MKRIFLSIMYLIAVQSVNAQSDINKTVDKFTQFYKANQADSIFALFSLQMKAAVKLEGTRMLITQVKGQLGEIVKSRPVGSPVNQITEFRLSFERPLVDLALMIQDSSIVGIQQRAVVADINDPVILESPDNFSVNNSSGSLYGTLTLPKAQGKVPVVLMIGGSGPTDRNMNQGQAMKSNSFLMLAKALAINGIASVRFDKRGVGKSMAALHSADVKIDDFISDADLFISKLKEDPRFSKVIVLGHSEGAAIGLISSLHKQPDAFISLCGYESNMGAILEKQLKTLASTEDYKIATDVLDRLKAGRSVNQVLPTALANIFTPSAQKFIISTMKYNSTKEIAKLKIPILVIGGTTDIQIGIDEAKQLAEANPRATLKLVPGMNHVLKSAPADRMLNIQTYNSSELPLHKDLVPVLTDFIIKTSIH